MKSERWTDAEFARALDLRSQGLTPEKIGPLLGRSTKAVKSRFRWHEMTPAEREARNEYERQRRVGQSKTLSKVAGVKFEAHKSQVPPDVISERNRRINLSARDLTASFFGDPLPGYSALERRA